MKKLLYLAVAIMMLAVCSCKKDDSASATVNLTQATVKSGSFMGFDMTSLYLEGTVSTSGTIGQTGFYVSSNKNMSSASNIGATSGAGTASFSANPLLTQFSDASTLYIQAYATVDGKTYTSSTKQVNI